MFHRVRQFRLNISYLMSFKYRIFTCHDKKTGRHIITVSWYASFALNFTCIVVLYVFLSAANHTHTYMKSTNQNPRQGRCAYWKKKLLQQWWYPSLCHGTCAVGKSSITSYDETTTVVEVLAVFSAYPNPTESNIILFRMRIELSCVRASK